MKTKSIINRATSLFLVICMVVGLIVIPTRLDESSHVHADSSTTTEHNCTIATSGATLDQATMNFFVANGINVGDYNFNNGPLIVSATEPVHWTGTLTVPDGIFIGICTGGFDYSMGEIVYEGRGGVYLLDCQTTYTEHKDCQAFTTNNILYVTQDIVNLYEDWAKAYGVTQPIRNENLTVALYEDITFSTNIFAPAAGYVRNICKNGHSLTFAEGVDFSKFGGTVSILDCHNMPRLYHECAVAHYKTDPITKENIATYMQQIPALTVGSIVCVHLAEDVDYEAEVKLPAGVIVAVCLNGFSLTGVSVDDSISTVGGFFTYDCEEHTCRIGGQSEDAAYVLTQDIVDFLEKSYERRPSSVQRNSHYALAGDVTLKSEMWLADEGRTVSFCKNGYTLNDEVGLNLSFGDVIYIDCNTATMKDLAHSSPIFGNTSFPMAQETLRDFAAAREPYLYSLSYSHGQYNYWSYLDADGGIWYVNGMMTNQYITPISVTQNRNDSYYFYGGYSSIWDSATATYNSVYSFMGTGYYHNSQSGGSYGYTAYLLPAVAEDGSIYLALVNSSYVTYDSELKAYFVKYTETKEVTETLADGSTETSYVTEQISVPVYLWSYDYSVSNLTVTIDGVTYYLAADGENGFHLDTVENYSINNLPSYNDVRYRFNGDEGILTFHLAEDVSWEGTLTAPAGTFLIIFTNGHTATGDYVHNDFGGVYVFNDDTHVCPSAPEIPITISSDFIDLMVLMSGGVIEMPNRQYVALGENLTSIDSRFVLPSSTTLYICTNGYTISDNVIAQLSANGATIELIDCEDLSHEFCEKLGDNPAQPVNQYLMVNFYQNSSGVFALGAGTYYLYLTSDITLNRELIIPEGVELHICLNGYTLKSPKILTEGGADYTPEKECNGAITVLRGAYLAVYDCSSNGTGCIAPDLEDMNGWGSLVAYAVLNKGVFVLDSGSLLGMAPIINGGATEINGGSIYGALAAIVQSDKLLPDGNEDTAPPPSLVIKDAYISAVMAGIIGQGGDVIIEDVDLNAGMLGVAPNFELSSTSNGESSNFVISGSSISVGSVDVFEFYEKLDNTGLYIDPEMIEELMGDAQINEDGKIIVENEELYGVISNADISISEDVVISLDPQAVEHAKKSADIMLGDGATITVTPSTSGTGTDNQITVTGNVGALPENTIGEIFVPGKGEAFEEDEEGNIITVDVTTTASLAGRTLTLNGLIQLNLFVSLNDSFINNENARIKVEFQGKTTEYKVTELRKNGAYRVISIGVPAKDYCANPIVVFTDGTVEWTNEKPVDTSVNGYLEQIISDTSGAYDSIKDLANHIKNYCMASATLFLGTEYTPTSEMQTYMSKIDEATFGNYEVVIEGTSDKVIMAGSTLFLEAGTTIRIYMQAAQGVDMSELDVYVDGVAKKATLYSTTQRLYYVEIENIAAKDLANFHTVEVDGVKLSYAAISYCYTVFRTKDTQPAELLDMCRALYGYYEAAYDYEINK